MRRAGLLLGIALLMTACSVPPPSDNTPEPAPAAEAPELDADAGKRVSPSLDALDRVEDTCGLDALKPHLGKNIRDIPPESLPDNARILKPDTEVTLDYVPARLNILTNEDGRVIGLKCG